MPPSLSIGAFVFGAVLVLLSLVAGKFKLFGAEVDGTVGKTGRVIAFLFGVFLISAALYPDNDQRSGQNGRQPGPGAQVAGQPKGDEPGGKLEVESVTTPPRTFRDYMPGTWEFRQTVPSTGVVSTYEIGFSRNGKFRGTRSVNGFLQEAFSGTWSTLPSSSGSFTLTFTYEGEAPNSITLRVIDQNSLEDGDNSSRWLRK